MAADQPLNSPDAPARPARRDWRDTLTAASDLALLGIEVTIAALPVVTAGAAVVAGSAAAHHWCENRSLPPLSTTWSVFRRALLPGVGALGVVAGVAGLLAADGFALSGHRVPGGGAMLVVTALVGAALLAIGALTVVRLGREPEGAWWAAARWAGRRVVTAPGGAAGLVAVLAVSAVLAFLVPLTAPLLVGYTLFALHVVAGRSAAAR